LPDVKVQDCLRNSWWSRTCGTSAKWLYCWKAMGADVISLQSFVLIITQIRLVPIPGNWRNLHPDSYRDGNNN